MVQAARGELQMYFTLKEQNNEMYLPVKGRQSNMSNQNKSGGSLVNTARNAVHVAEEQVDDLAE